MEIHWNFMQLFYSGGREVKVERLPSERGWVMPYEEPASRYWPATSYAGSQWPMTTTPWDDTHWPVSRWARFDDDLMNMGRLLREMESDMNNLMARAGRWMGDEGTWLTPWVESQSEGKYRANIPIGANFEPEDVRVTLKNGLLTVRAKKEKTEGDSRFYQEVVRQLTLPRDVEMDQIKSVFNPEGYLSVEAPMPKGSIEDKVERQIPVQAA